MPLEGFVRPTETRESSIPSLYVSLCIGTITLCQGLWARYLKMIYCPPQHCCKNPWIIKVWFYYTRALKRGVHVVTWGWRRWAPHRFFSHRLHLSGVAKKLCSKVKICRSQEKRGWKRRKQGGWGGWGAWRRIWNSQRGEENGGEGIESNNIITLDLELNRDKLGKILIMRKRLYRWNMLAIICYKSEWGEAQRTGTESDKRGGKRESCWNKKSILYCWVLKRRWQLSPWVSSLARHTHTYHQTHTHAHTHSHTLMLDAWAEEYSCEDDRIKGHQLNGENKYSRSSVFANQHKSSIICLARL